MGAGAGGRAVGVGWLCLSFVRGEDESAGAAARFACARCKRALESGNVGRKPVVAAARASVVEFEAWSVVGLTLEVVALHGRAGA